MAEQVAARRDATGTRRRLQALIAVGHPPTTLAHRLGVATRVVARIIRGTTATVSPGLHVAVCDLYDRLWDVAPPERTLTERRAAAAARALAAGHGWPAPMGLDDNRIDDLAYRPRAQWRPVAGSGEVRQHRHGRSSTSAALPGQLSTAVGGREPSPGSRCQAASAWHRHGGRS
jgi:hypothetical protein